MPAPCCPTLSRRALLSWCLATGATALVAACGGATNTATSGPVGPDPATAAPATAGLTATDSTATSSTAPPSASAPSALSVAASTSNPATLASGATATSPAAGVAADPGTLLAALSTVPQGEFLPGLAGVAYADLATLKSNYGLGAANSPLDARGLVTDGVALAALLRAIPLPAEAGAQYALDPIWQNTLGYNLWQIDRAIAVGNGPASWTRMTGRFDRAGIGAVLNRAGHKATTYDGATILARGDDAQIATVNDRFTEMTLMRFDRVIIEGTTLTTTNRLALAQGGIDVAAKKGPSLAADPDHAALAAALGAVVGARLLSADPFLHPVRTTAQPATALATGGAQLHSYRRVGIGLRDNGATHTMVVALAYEQLTDARANLPVLRARAATYTLASGEPLAARATLGEPTIVAASGRTVVVLPFTIADTVNLDLWQQLYFREEYGFLAL